MGFEGMEEPSKHVSFGTSADRPIYPSQIPNDKFGNEFNPWHGTKDAGPANYDNDQFTTFTYNNKPMTKLGYVLGARTAQRKYFATEFRAPTPTRYQDMEKEIPKPSFKPFNNSASRFLKENKAIQPGPGAYEHNVERNRSVAMLHSFGGRAKTIPHVDIKCIVHNVVKNCDNCNTKPEGDFYQFKSTILCTKCYEYNYKWQEKYSRSYLVSFKKARDCSFMHEHAGTSAAIQKISDKELRKLKQKEAYLSLYYEN